MLLSVALLEEALNHVPVVLLGLTQPKYRPMCLHKGKTMNDSNELELYGFPNPQNLATRSIWCHNC